MILMRDLYQLKGESMEMNNNSWKLLKILGVLIILYIGQLFYFHYTNIIMKVDGKDITKAQFNEAFEKNANTSGFLSLGIDIKKDKKSALYNLIKDKTIDDLVKQTLINEEIEKRNIKVSKEEVDNEIKKAIDQFGSKEKLSAFLDKNEITSSTFKKNISEELTKKKLANSISKISISDADAKKYYKEHLDSFKHPERVRASHIFIEASPEKIKQEIKTKPENQGLSEKEIQTKVNTELALKLEKTNKLIAKLKKDPKSFAQIAKENSEDSQTANQGGDAGIIAKQQLAKPLSEIVFSLKPNTISEAVQTPSGYHIITVTDKIKAETEPFDKVKNKIVATLEYEKQDKTLDDLAESLKKKAKIEYVKAQYKPKTISPKK